MTLVMAVDKFRTGENVFGDVVIESDLDRALEANKPDVVVDFTLPSAVLKNTKKYLKAKSETCNRNNRAYSRTN